MQKKRLTDIKKGNVKGRSEEDLDEYLKKMGVKVDWAIKEHPDFFKDLDKLGVRELQNFYDKKNKIRMLSKIILEGCIPLKLNWINLR